jgi:hypothetical protein
MPIDEARDFLPFIATPERRAKHDVLLFFPPFRKAGGSASGKHIWRANSATLADQPL